MTVEEFKFIFMMEYMHRMWGRAIGGFFLLPAIYFWRKGYFCAKTKKSVLLLGTLIGLQGLMGWYMVKSGLEDRFQDPNDVPRVSQYRLASHLAAAFILYSLSLSRALSMLIPTNTFVIQAKKAFNIKGLTHLTKAMVLLTAISGAFVAGLDAGLVYNSFPKMGDSWIPDDMWQFEPIQKNITENPTTVQFNHRILGISTVTLTTALWLVTRRMKLPKRANCRFCSCSRLRSTLHFSRCSLSRPALILCFTSRLACFSATNINVAAVRASSADCPCKIRNERGLELLTAH